MKLIDKELAIDTDFWSDAELKTIFYDEYISKVSSKIMWSLLLVYHPNSIYSTLDTKSAKELVEKDYLKKSLEWDKYTTTVDKIQKFLLSKSKRLLLSWEEKLEERDRFMHSMPYNADTFELQDKMLAATSKL